MNRPDDIEDWARRAMARWPNVPHLYGWLRLDRRGRWLIRGEEITRPQIIDTINANYSVDARGCWYFQNGPQRGYVALDLAPLILRAPATGEAVVSHLGRPVGALLDAAIDEHGGVWLRTARGPGGFDDRDLGWLIERLTLPDGSALTLAALDAAVAQPSGTSTGLRLRLAGHDLPVRRIDEAEIPAEHDFVREPSASTP